MAADTQHAPSKKRGPKPLYGAERTIPRTVYYPAAVLAAVEEEADRLKISVSQVMVRVAADRFGIQLPEQVGINERR